MRYFSGIFTSMLYYQLMLGLLIKIGYMVAPSGYEQHMLPIAFLLTGGSAGVLCYSIVGVRSKFILVVLVFVTTGLVALLSGIAPSTTPLNTIIMYLSLALSVYFTIRGYLWASKNITLKWHKGYA